MKRIVLPSTDLEVSVMSYGTADLGIDMSDDECAKLINLYRDAGGNFIDTAHVYAAWAVAGAGSSERAIGRYLKSNGVGDLVVATKGGHPSFGSYRRVDQWLSPGRVHADIEDSLGRLGVERIDLYYLHRDDTRCTVGEVIEMMNAEVDAGTIGAFAASNWKVERIAEANAYAQKHSLRGFVASEIEFSLTKKQTPVELPNGVQTIYAQDHDTAFHERTGLPLCAFGSTGRGFFTATDPGRLDAHGPENRRRLERAQSLASQKGATATQIALAWLMHHAFPCIPITGTCTLEHLRENLGAVDVTLTDEEARWLTA